MLAMKMHPTRRDILAASLTAATTLSAQTFTPLLDGKSLNGWRVTPFPGHAEVLLKDGAVHLPAGKPSTGITFTGKFPRVNYSIRYEATRLDGSDIFACLTFPCGESQATFVAGAWGGDIVGISDIDGWDANDNETRTYFTFEPQRWYAFELVVTPDWIRASIDGKSLFRVEIGGRRLTLFRDDTGLSNPLGFSTYNTTGAIRKAEYRLLRAQ